MIEASRSFIRMGHLAVIGWALGVVPSAVAQATTVDPSELDCARRWAAAKFRGVLEEPRVQTGLVVVANHDPVQRDARAGRPLNIAGKEYTRGLYCHAVSEVVVHLPGPAKTLTAVIGLDSNDQTRPGRGTIVFSVDASEKELFRSERLREGSPGVPIEVDLGGSDELVLHVSDGGDGISCDQADWADARVVLADGQAMWLGDLPLIDASRPPPSVEPPFSFVYGGASSAELLARCSLSRQVRKLDDRRTEHSSSWTDPDTGLVVQLRGIEYRDFPTVEWTLHFENTGPNETPVLSNILPLDIGVQRSPGSEFVLHHHTGSPCLPEDYRPWATELGPRASKRISAAGGRPTNSDLPYFNLSGLDHGWIVVVGWPGQWAAEFARDESNGLRLTAGQELTRFVLHPGERVRTPLIVLQFWRGDRIRSQNVWRRWMLAHNLPRPGGKLPPIQMAACSSHQFGEMIHANTANQRLFIDRYLEEDLGLDYWWMDAGWYWNESGWPNVGTWEVDTNRFPGGLRPICDHAHSRGVKTIVWFEPERVTPGTWLYEEHPEWLLGQDGGTKLLNLGNPEARSWLQDHVDRCLVEQGVDLYRQDFNIDPLPYWTANDSPDRQGITEIRYVEGYLAYWDELRRRHPDMLIDSCASGGRRNDLETLRRAVPLLRSDYIMEPVGNQGHTYGISSWYPYHGTGTGSGAISPYLLRSVLGPHFTACFDVRRTDLDYEMIRRVLKQWRSYAPYYFGDYYPLTPYSLETDVWMAWQFDCPESGEGTVQAFRRSESIYEAARLKLRGLDPEARYRLTNLDRSATTEMTGQALLEAGITVVIDEQPGSAVIVYKQIR